jgi:excisionase family DNA binding protein
MSVMVIDVGEAARRLGVSERRVRDLIAAGDLAAVRVSGRYAIAEDAFDALATRARPRAVRAFSRRIAWAAAALVDDVRPTWISQSELSRLRKRLSGSDRDPDVWRARLADRAATTITYRVATPNLRGLLSSKAVTRSGVSARSLVADRQIDNETAALWLATGANLDTTVAQFGMLQSADGNVTMRIADVEGMSRTGQDDDTYRLVIAADLLDSPDARGRRSGAHLLNAVLAEHRWPTEGTEPT